MSRIAKVFQKDRERAKFIAYVCALDPDYETSLKICRCLVESGIDILELGVPFSDPVADGKTNQLAAERAISTGGTPDQVFDLVRDIRKFSEVPIVLYTYYNIVFNKGPQNYTRTAADAGVDGILSLDLPPEEAGEMIEACKHAGIDRIFLIAPTTPEARIPVIVKDASGFAYYVSREGVTGERSDVATDIKKRVDLIRKYTSLPIGVGFGISNADQVREIAANSDAVIVGSSIVKLIELHGDSPDTLMPLLRDKIVHMRSGLI
jgi:tryptophan synthase alpha chain